MAGAPVADHLLTGLGTACRQVAVKTHAHCIKESSEPAEPSVGRGWIALVNDDLTRRGGGGGKGVGHRDDGGRRIRCRSGPPEALRRTMSHGDDLAGVAPPHLGNAYQTGTPGGGSTVAIDVAAPTKNDP